MAQCWSSGSRFDSTLTGSTSLAWSAWVVAVGGDVLRAAQKAGPVPPRIPVQGTLAGSELDLAPTLLSMGGPTRSSLSPAHTLRAGDIPVCWLELSQPPCIALRTAPHIPLTVLMVLPIDSLTLHLA